MTRGEYLEAVKETMTYWVDCHFNYEEWLKEWFQTDDYNLTEYCSEVLHWKLETNGDIRSLNYDIRKLAYPETAKRMVSNLVRCPECGQMDEFSTYCDCDCDTEDPEIEEVIDWLETFELDNLITDADIEVGLRVIFEDYLEQVRLYTEPIKEEIEENLSELIENPTDEAIAWANHLMHVSGYMLKDYGERFGLEWDVIQAVSEQGLSYFEEEE